MCDARVGICYGGDPLSARDPLAGVLLGEEPNDGE